MSIDYTKPNAADVVAESVTDPAPAGAAGATADTILPARPGQEYRENMLLERLDRLSDELEQLYKSGASNSKIEQMQRRIEITLESLDEVRRPKTGRRGLGDMTLIELGVLIVLAIIVFSIGKAVWGHFSDSDESISSYSVSGSSGDQAFLDAVHSGTDMADPDDMTLFTGGVICESIEDKGESATRAEFATSSYSSSDQDVIWAAAQSYLC